MGFEDYPSAQGARVVQSDIASFGHSWRNYDTINIASSVSKWIMKRKVKK